MSQPIDISPQAKKTVKELLQRYLPGVTVWAYGSRVKWTARPDSDLDLVVFATQEQRSNVANLREAFEESNLPFRVDVLIWEEVPEKFREEIREGYVVVEGKSEERSGQKSNTVEPTLIQRLINDGLLLINDGYRAKNSELSDIGLPFARAGNINNGFLFADADRFPEGALDKVGFKISEPGDVVFTSKGTVGRFALVRETTPRFVYSPQLCFWRSLDQMQLNPRWLYYWMQSREFFSQYHGVAAQSDMAEYVSLRDQRKMSITIPSRERQETIARILGTLDDQIELNRQMNQTLEAMAQAIFKSWFVNFDPVKAKQAALALGRDPERAAMAALNGKLRVPKNPADLPVEDLAKAEAELDQLGEEERKQLERTAALFPDGFVESELGLIPEGWKIAPLVDACDIISGGTPKTSVEAYWNGSIPWASAKDVSQCSETFLISTERSITAEGLMNSAAKLIEPDATVVVARGATTGRMTMFGKQIAMNQTCYGLRAKNGAHFFLYCLCQSFLPQIVHAGHGSVFNTITTSTFRQSKVLIPNDSVALLFHHLTTPLYRSIQSNIEERFLLVQLRDTLLPKLLSGQLDICEAAAQTENALP